MPAAEAAIAAVKARWPAATDRVSTDHAAVNVPAAELPAALGLLRDGHGFDFLADLSGVDWSEAASPRFSVVYHLFSTSSHEYVRVSADCPDNAEPEVPSISGLWPGANWHEREAYDMYGIKFSGHPDLRRILMWDGYPHFPLRKDFPLAGIDSPLPDAEVVAETGTNAIAAPMMGGPFVATNGAISPTEAEPRALDQSWTERRPKPGP